jgi:thiol-disulfide isomerase/thioredoxin
MELLLIKSEKLSRVFCSFIFLAFLALAPSPAISETLPNIVGRALDGQLISLKRAFENKPTVVNFWWVKCAPCKKELPDLITKSKAHPNVDFIYVHAETNAKTKSPYNTETVATFLKQRELTLDKVIIGNTQSRLSAGVEALPTTLLINREGHVEQTLVGFTEENTAAIKNWLKELKL